MVIHNQEKINANFISAKEVVEKFNVTYQTVNHYTNLGLIHVIMKNGNVRMYDERHVRGRLAQIAQLINEGYPLRLIQKKFNGA